MSTVTSFQFGIGDGVDTTFDILNPSGDVSVNPVVSSLYRTDWQGKQLLYTTARTNLCLRSEEIDHASWVKENASVTVDAIAAPDGTSTADKLIDSGAGAGDVQHQARQSIAVADNSVVTASVHLKMGERRYSRISVGTKAGALPGVYVDLQLGTILSAVSSPTSYAIASLGDGWYRVSVTANVGAGGATPAIRVWIAQSNGDITFTGDGTGFYVWGAQFEVASAATSYIGPTLAAAVPLTDYAVAGSVATFSPAPLDRALLEWTGTDDNAAFNPRYGSASMTASFGRMGAR